MMTQTFTPVEFVPNQTRVRHAKTLREGLVIKKPHKTSIGTREVELVHIETMWYDDETQRTERQYLDWKTCDLEILPEIAEIITELESAPAELAGTNVMPVFLPDGSTTSISESGAINQQEELVNESLGQSGEPDVSPIGSTV